MPYDLRVIPSNDFVRLDAEGHIDMDSSRSALAEIARASAESGLSRMLLDLRSVYSELTPGELYMLASAFGDIGFRPEQKLALLHRPMSFDRPEFFAMVAQHRGWKVAAFGGFEDAFNWLNTE
jgi:hypothetical protein